MNTLETIQDILETSQDQNLYRKLVLQLNKDLLYANIDLELDEDTLPSSLKLVLQDEVFHLIQNKFSEYLNLLYIVDVSEQKIKELQAEDTLQLAEQVTFLILKREWQKVWFKAQYS